MKDSNIFYVDFLDEEGISDDESICPECGEDYHYTKWLEKEVDRLRNLLEELQV